MFKKIIAISLFIIFTTSSYASGGDLHLDKAPIDRNDIASLQRGAQIFVNKCLGCHSAQYLRYKTVAKDIGMVDKEGEVLVDILQKNLNFVSDKPNDNILTSMRAEDAEKWFGTAPPDLSLVARSRGVDWLYTYLRSFYRDDTRPFGVNNTVFPDVGMPHVLLEEQGMVIPSYKTLQTELGEVKVVEKIELIQEGAVGSKANYDKMVADLVNFLDYMGEPVKQERERIGVYVIMFLFVFTLAAYLLKREFWKDVYRNDDENIK